MIKTLEKIIDATALTATSGGHEVGERRNLSLELIGANIAGGNTGTLTVEVSNDFINWVPYNRLVPNIANSNVQADTRQASIVQAVTGSSFAFFPRDHFNYIRVTVTVAGGGTGNYTVWLSAY